MVDANNEEAVDRLRTRKWRPHKALAVMVQNLEQARALAEIDTVAERALTGEGLGPADLDRLRGADVLILAGLADAVREAHRGDEVRVAAGGAPASDGRLVEVKHDSARDLTGQQLLIEVALTRLSTPANVAVGVSYESIGLELAQVALLFGADALWGDLSGRKTLPLLDNPRQRQGELEGLIQRAGRRARWESMPQDPQPQLAQPQAAQPKDRS